MTERFEIERLANTGGMGHVYRARDRMSGDAVALEVLDRASKISEQEWRDAFLQRVPENAKALALAESWSS